MAAFTDVCVLFLRVSENVIEMELSLYFSPSQGRLGECLVLMTARQGWQTWAQVCATPPCANGLTAFFFFLAEKKVWTVLTHDGPAAVTVQGSSLPKPHVRKFNYSASAEQLRAIVSGSEQCQQEVAYNCRKSRLFNTKGITFP